MLDYNMYDTTPEHARIYGLEAKKPLYIQLESDKQKGSGKSLLKQIDMYAESNGHDVIFGHITQHVHPSIDIIKSMINKAGFITIEGNNDFYKLIA